MDGLERNKLATACLVALLLLKSGDELSKFLIQPADLPAAQYAYVVETLGTDAALDGPAAPVLIATLLGNADTVRGAKLARQCAQCHTLTKGGPSGIGPNLYGVVGGPMAHATGYAYSRGLAARHGEAWTFENLSALLHKPREFIAGTKMAFAGLRQDQDRADIIAYLNTLSDQPLDLPAPAPAPEPAAATSPPPSSAAEKTDVVAPAAAPVKTVTGTEDVR